jgi:hypothetical protein
MEKSKLTETEKGETGEEQSQEHAHHFFDIKGIVHKEFFLAGQTVNSAYCCVALRRLRENVRRLRLELWRQKIWPSHQDNAHFLTREFLTRNNEAVVPYPS